MTVVMLVMFGDTWLSCITVWAIVTDHAPAIRVGRRSTVRISASLCLWSFGVCGIHINHFSYINANNTSLNRIDVGSCAYKCVVIFSDLIESIDPGKLHKLGILV